MVMTMDTSIGAEEFLRDHVERRPEGAVKPEEVDAKLALNLLPEFNQLHDQHRAHEFGMTEPILGSLCTMLAWQAGVEQPPTKPPRA